MLLSIGGFSPDTEEQEIRNALEEFGVTVNKVTIEPSRLEDGQLAVIDVDTDELGAKVLSERINGHVWKGKRLRARTFVFLK